MQGQVLAAIGASVVTLGMFGALAVVSSDARRLQVDSGTGSTLTYNLNRPQAATLWPMWRVTQATSAHSALVVDVEARRVDLARQIAEEIVDPVRSRGYHEILIYVRQAGDPTGAMRRVQWTPRTGFVEMAYAPVR